MCQYTIYWAYMNWNDVILHDYSYSLFNQWGSIRTDYNCHTKRKGILVGTAEISGGSKNIISRCIGFYTFQEQCFLLNLDIAD